MSKKDHTEGTFIHGIAASEHLDSSGERIKIKGVDISSLTKDGVFNFEHQSKEASSIVGKILEAKKIIKQSDCENEYHEHFWNKIKMPFVYVSGELFDAEGHQSACDVAAMLKYDNKSDKRKTKRLINFSIEGSRLEKDGANILKCIARKISITITPCNKVCEAEEMKPKKENKNLLQDILGKREESYCEIMKTTAGYIPPNKHAVGVGNMREGSAIKPKRTVSGGNESSTWKVGDRTDHTAAPKDKQNAYKPKTGRDIYGKMPVIKSDSKKKKKNFYDSNVKKALTAGSGMGSPSVKSQGSALQGEDMDKEMMSVCKAISDENWKTFTKKEDLIDFLSIRLPNTSPKEIMALAKTVAYTHEKKKEIKLAEMIKNDMEKGDLLQFPKKEKKRMMGQRENRKKKGTPHDRTKEGNPDYGEGYVEEDNEPRRKGDINKGSEDLEKGARRGRKKIRMKRGLEGRRNKPAPVEYKERESKGNTSNQIEKAKIDDFEPSATKRKTARAARGSAPNVKTGKKRVQMRGKDGSAINPMPDPRNQEKLKSKLKEVKNKRNNERGVSNSPSSKDLEYPKMAASEKDV